MEHTFLIDNYVLVLERKKIKFRKKRKKFLTNPILKDVNSPMTKPVYYKEPLYLKKTFLENEHTK